MSKKSEEITEYEDWQYEKSMEDAQDWMDNEVIPSIIDYDFENDDPDYVPGTATYGMFCNMAVMLVEVGYTKEELIQIVEEMFNDEITVPVNTTLH